MKAKNVLILLCKKSKLQTEHLWLFKHMCSTWNKDKIVPLQDVGGHRNCFSKTLFFRRGTICGFSICTLKSFTVSIQSTCRLPRLWFSFVRFWNVQKWNHMTT
jgi:hypothetical protein